MTKEEIEMGLTHPDWWVRSRFADRTDYTPTEAQVERGLTDEDEDDSGGVRWRFARPTVTELQGNLQLDEWVRALRLIPARDRLDLVRTRGALRIRPLGGFGK